MYRETSESLPEQQRLPDNCNLAGNLFSEPQQLQVNSEKLQQDIVLAGGTLIDGRGGQPLADSAIVIRGQTIAQGRNNKGFNYGESAKVIDVAGKYVLPGLIDIHVHYSDWMGQLFLSHGVTTVKDLGNDIDWISSVSRDIARGKIHGPRILYVGNGLDAPPPDRNTHVAVTDEGTARRAVQLLPGKGGARFKCGGELCVQ